MIDKLLVVCVLLLLLLCTVTFFSSLSLVCINNDHWCKVLCLFVCMLHLRTSLYNMYLLQLVVTSSLPLSPSLSGREVPLSLSSVVSVGIVGGSGMFVVVLVCCCFLSLSLSYCSLSVRVSIWLFAACLLSPSHLKSLSLCQCALLSHSTSVH